jgi:hypothetical protein
MNPEELKAIQRPQRRVQILGPGVIQLVTPADGENPGRVETVGDAVSVMIEWADPIEEAE